MLRLISCEKLLNIRRLQATYPCVPLRDETDLTIGGLGHNAQQISQKEHILCASRLHVHLPVKTPFKHFWSFNIKYIVRLVDVRRKAFSTICCSPNTYQSGHERFWCNVYNLPACVGTTVLVSTCLRGWSQNAVITKGRKRKNLGILQVFCSIQGSSEPEEMSLLVGNAFFLIRNTTKCIPFYAASISSAAKFSLLEQCKGCTELSTEVHFSS